MASVVSNGKNSQVLDQLTKLIMDGLESGEVRPLPVTVYPPESVEHAFRSMLKGQHRGKLILDIGSKQTIECRKRTYFHQSKVYLIVGGFGGMGLEIIDWMASRGARKFLVSSRSGPKSGYQKFCIDGIRSRYSSIQIAFTRADLTNKKGCQGCLKEAAKLGEIGGVFNLAAVLIDGIFLNQSASNFDTVCKAKISITRNLDIVTRQNCPGLDYFVCFSSVASNGNAGQSNYAFGNSFMERLCEKRKVDGLPALAIQWGPVGDVGVASRKFGPNEVIGGFVSQKISSCLEILEIFLNSSCPVCFSAIPAKKQIVQSNDVLLRIGRILGLKDIKSMDENASLRKLGLDSLQFIEIQHFLASERGLHLNYVTISELTLKDLKAVQNESRSDNEIKEDALIQRNSRILIKMNDKVNDPVFFFPPGVADFMSMADLAYWADRAVIGVDLPKNVVEGAKDVDQITETLYQEIVKDYPNIKKYQFVGYSLGVLVGYDVFRKIQQRLGVDRVGKVIFLDMTPYGAVVTLTAGQRMQERNTLSWDTMKDNRAAHSDSAFNDRLKMVRAMEKISGEKDGEKNFQMFFGNAKRFFGLELDLEVPLKADVLLFEAINKVSPVLSRVNAEPGKVCLRTEIIRIRTLTTSFSCLGNCRLNQHKPY